MVVSLVFVVMLAAQPPATDPVDVDAQIAKGSALLRSGDWQQALAVLKDIEPIAGENSDLFGALARAYRRAGDDEHALEYFRRAKTLAPADFDAVSGFESTAQAYGHWLLVEGFGQHVSPSPDAGSGTIAASVRVAPKWHLLGSVRVQQSTGVTDSLAGGGFELRAGRATVVTAQALVGPDNTMLAQHDTTVGLTQYAGVFEIGGNVRALEFADVDVVTASPVFAWDIDSWRLDGRYTYSRSSFHATGKASGDNSVMLRETWRKWRRVSLNGTYAYGIESFEDLTADRIAALGASTIAGGLSISTPSLTRLYATWEHQWRSNDTTLDRFTITLVQSFP